MYRNLSFFTEFYAIARQYPQLAMNGLPSETFGVLSHEIRRRINRAEGDCASERSLKCLQITD